MKFRKSFVTNSSSSSFICEVCGEVVSGYDMGLAEAEMYECEAGHTFCCEHVIKKPNINQKIRYIRYKNKASHTIPFDKTSETAINKLIEDFLKDVIKQGWYDEDEVEDVTFEDLMNDFSLYDDSDCFPSLFCPICNFEEIPDYIISEYFLKTYNKTKKMMAKELQDKFADYNEFNDFIKK